MPSSELLATNPLLPGRPVDVLLPPANMFWGERYGQLKDPFGVVWAMNGPIKK